MEICIYIYIYNVSFWVVLLMNNMLQIHISIFANHSSKFTAVCTSFTVSHLYIYMCERKYMYMY
jgi:hypothetical protein